MLVASCSICICGIAAFFIARPKAKPLVSMAGQISFTSNVDGNSEIYIINLDGSIQKNLSNHRANDQMATWSTYGQRVAFVSDRDGNSEIYTMLADGSNQTNITNNPASDYYPVWSVDGKSIAFINDRDGVEPTLYSMTAQGSSVNSLTIDYMPYWAPICFDSPWTPKAISPDGNHIVYDDHSDIFIAASIDSYQAQLTSQASLNWCPVWSPDGTKIAFLSTRDKHSNIYVMNIDGTQQIRLTNDEFYSERTFAWSPDGTRIAFVSYHGYLNNDISVMNADGSGVTRLVKTPASIEGDVAWRPSYK